MRKEGSTPEAHGNGRFSDSGAGPWAGHYEPKPPSPHSPAHLPFSFGGSPQAPSSYTPRLHTPVSRRSSAASGNFAFSPHTSRPTTAGDVKTIALRSETHRNEMSPTVQKLTQITDRIAIYGTDMKNEAKMKREAEDRRAAMLREQVLKCEKDLLDECELRQEADRIVETKLTNHLHLLEKNVRDASQRLVAMIEPFVPRLKTIEGSIQRESEARRVAIEEVREDLREAIAMTAGVAARSDQQNRNLDSAGSNSWEEELEALKVAHASEKENAEAQLLQLSQRVAMLEKELEDEREGRSNDRRQLEDIIRNVMKPSIDIVNRHRAELETRFTDQLEDAVKRMSSRIDADKTAEEANGTAARTMFQNELDKRLRIHTETLQSMEQHVKSEFTSLKLAAQEERQRREKAEEDIITNLGDAIMQLRVM